MKTIFCHTVQFLCYALLASSSYEMYKKVTGNLFAIVIYEA